jgi:hypothetical protein
MLSFTKKLLSKQPICTHNTNYDEHTYIEAGCPMVSIICWDCGYEDTGPVIMDEIPDNWETNIMVRNGERV